MEISVNPEQLRTEAEVIKSNGEDLKRILDNAHRMVAEMHSVWTGRQYSELVKSFNRDCPIFGDVVTLTREDIPAALVAIANSYLAADGQESYGTMNSGVVTYSELAVNEDEVISINTAEVEGKRNSLSSEFKNAKEKIAEIETKISNLSWTSASAENFKAKVRKYKDEISSCFDEIDSKFTEWMSGAASAMQTAEKKVDIG